MPSESLPSLEYEPSVAKRFTDFIDHYVEDVLPDAADCRKRMLRDLTTDNADTIIVARYDADPSAPMYHLTQTSTHALDQNALTITYDGKDFELLAGFATEAPTVFLADGILMSLEHGKAEQTLVPITLPMT